MFHGQVLQHPEFIDSESMQTFMTGQADELISLRKAPSMASRKTIGADAGTSDPPKEERVIVADEADFTRGSGADFDLDEDNEEDDEDDLAEEDDDQEFEDENRPSETTKRSSFFGRMSTSVSSTITAAGQGIKERSKRSAPAPTEDNLEFIEIADYLFMIQAPLQGALKQLEILEKRREQYRSQLNALMAAWSASGAGSEGTTGRDGMSSSAIERLKMTLEQVSLNSEIKREIEEDSLNHTLMEHLDLLTQMNRALQARKQARQKLADYNMKATQDTAEEGGIDNRRSDVEFDPAERQRLEQDCSEITERILREYGRFHTDTRHAIRTAMLLYAKAQMAFHGSMQSQFQDFQADATNHSITQYTPTLSFVNLDSDSDDEEDDDRTTLSFAERLQRVQVVEAKKQATNAASDGPQFVLSPASSVQSTGDQSADKPSRKSSWVPSMATKVSTKLGMFSMRRSSIADKSRAGQGSFSTHDDL